MPFDFKKYDAKCANLDADALQREWEHYTRLISGAATSTAVSGLAIPFTLGVSSIGVGLAAPAIHNARKKREIIERHLQSKGRTHHTRKRDVFTAGAISGTVGVVTLGLAPVGADAICNTAAEHSIAYIAENELGVKIATHLALDAAAVAAEETHMHSRKEKEAWRAYTQAVKEGKNPPLPSSDLKLPVPTNNQVGDFKTNHQDTSYQAAPSIHVVPPLDQKTSEAPAVYFPPPPGPGDLNVHNPLHRRHSTSTLSLDAQQPAGGAPQPPSDGHLMYGTATAFSAPMVGGQSYYVQLTGPSPDLPSRPASAIGDTKLYPDPVAGYFPPQHFAESPGMKTEQDSYQYQTHRPRAYSTASFDGPPSYEMHQQTQFLHGTSQTSLPLPPPQHPPPSAPMSPFPSSYAQTTHMSGYFVAPPGNPTFQHQPQYGQNMSSYDQSTGYAHYNPNDYAQSQQQQNFHAPAQIVYSPHDLTYQPSDQKAPLVHQYQLSSPPTPIGNSTYYSTPGQQPHYSYAPGTIDPQQAPYFPPPPVAY